MTSAELVPDATTRSPSWSSDWLAGLGVRDPERGGRDLRDLTRRGGAGRCADVARLAVQLDAHPAPLPRPGHGAGQPRAVRGRRARGSSATLRDLADDPRTTEILLQVFSTSQYFSEVLIRDPALLDWLQRGPERRDRASLIDDLWDDAVDALDDEDEQSLAFRRFRQRESLRIGYNDIVRGLPLEVITHDLSDLADACVEAAVPAGPARAPRHDSASRTARDGAPARFVVLGLGKLGGAGAQLQLRHRPDLPLRRRRPDRRARRSSPTPSSSRGWEASSSACWPSTRRWAWPIASTCGCGPTASRGPWPARSAATLGYYVTRGPDLGAPGADQVPRRSPATSTLGQTFLRGDHAVRLSPLPGRRRDRRDQGAEAADRAAHASRPGPPRSRSRPATAASATSSSSSSSSSCCTAASTPRSGTRNTLHGHRPARAGRLLDAPRSGTSWTTPTASSAGSSTGCRSCSTARRTRCPATSRSCGPWPSAWAIRRPAPGKTGPARPQRFLTDYRSKTELNRRILNHLLHDAFRGDAGAAVDPVVDLVLDPEPGAELITEVLARTRSATARRPITT